MSRDLKNKPIEDLQAGDAFRSTLINKADGWDRNAPLWHGWAIMDAFLAGVDYSAGKKRRPRRKTAPGSRKRERK